MRAVLWYSAAFVGISLNTSLLAKARIVDRDSLNRVAKQYIIKLKTTEGASLEAADYVVQQAERLTQDYGVQVLHQYSRIFNGVAIKAEDDQLEAMALDPLIERIETNKLVKINSKQTAATWGIDRVDSLTGLDKIYTYSNTGKGVHAYIIDTGTRTSHKEFTGRVGEGFTAINDGKGFIDCHGHGTHVSATIGGTQYGVAKEVIIHPVRVLDCTGSGDDAGVIAGIDWVAKNAIKPAVVNMSLGGEVSPALDDSVRAAIKAGVVFVVAAGNESTTACSSSPADVKEALTIGATTSTDTRASFSNFGVCVDLFAPGQNISSAWNSSDTAKNTISGTSMASPHVAGVVALYMEQNPQASPAQIETIIKNKATKNIVKSPGRGSPNLFIYTNPAVSMEADLN